MSKKRELVIKARCKAKSIIIPRTRPSPRIRPRRLWRQGKTEVGEFETRSKKYGFRDKGLLIHKAGHVSVWNSSDSDEGTRVRIVASDGRVMWFYIDRR